MQSALGSLKTLMLPASTKPMVYTNCLHGMCGPFPSSLFSSFLEERRYVERCPLMQPFGWHDLLRAESQARQEAIEVGQAHAVGWGALAHIKWRRGIPNRRAWLAGRFWPLGRCSISLPWRLLNEAATRTNWMCPQRRQWVQG